MERHSRVMAGGFLVMAVALVVAGPGCRSMKNEVPPGKPYSTTGGGPPPVGFNSDPHPQTAVGTYGSPLMPGSQTAEGPAGAGSASQYGIPSPNASPYGAPSANKYGGMPGTLSPAPLNQ